MTVQLSAHARFGGYLLLRTRVVTRCLDRRLGAPAGRPRKSIALHFLLIDAFDRIQLQSAIEGCRRRVLRRPGHSHR